MTFWKNLSDFSDFMDKLQIGMLYKDQQKNGIDLRAQYQSLQQVSTESCWVYDLRECILQEIVPNG